MPDPVKAPPEERVNELITNTMKRYWEKYDKEPSSNFKELHERDTKMIDELIKEIAIKTAIIEVYENK